MTIHYFSARLVSLRSALVIGCLIGAVPSMGSWLSQDLGPSGDRGRNRWDDSTLTIVPARTPRTHVIYQPVTGDFILSARLLPPEMTSGVRAGLSVRPKEAADGSALCDVTIAGREVSLTWKGAPDGPEETQRILLPPTTANGYTALRLERHGDELSASMSVDGTAWARMAGRRVQWPLATHVGFIASATDQTEEIVFQRVVLITARQRASERPTFGESPAFVPGVIEVENFDVGSEGVAYREVAPGEDDLSPSSLQPATYRLEPVFIAPNSPGPGYHVAGTRPAEWLEYTVQVVRAGRYRVHAYVASLTCGGMFHVELDGKDVTGPLRVPITNSEYDGWVDVAGRLSDWPAGTHHLRLVMDEGTPYRIESLGSFDRLEIVADVGAVAPSAAAAVIPPRATTSPGHAVRILLSEERIDSIRSAVRSPGSHSKWLMDAMQARVDQGDLTTFDIDPSDRERNLARGHLAREAALLFAITGRASYAERSIAEVQRLYDNADADNLTPDRPSGGERADGLRMRASLGISVALAYAWASDGWTEGQRAFVGQALNRAIDSWPCFGYKTLKSPYVWPDVAVWRASELLMIAAMGQRESRAARWEVLTEWLLSHIKAAYGPLGLSPSGSDDARLAASFLVPAALAAQQSGDSRLFDALRDVGWWRLIMAIGSFGAPNCLQTGMDECGEAFRPAAWASLSLATTPAAHIPEYLWFYDRYVGRLAPATRSVAGVNAAPSGAAVWALLFYPNDVSSQPPSGKLAQAVDDRKRGVYFFRDRWADADDTQVMVAGDDQYTPYQDAANRAQAFDIGLISNNHRFASGGGGREGNLSSGLLVDGRSYDRREHTGRTELFEPTSRGGYVVIDGGEKYRALGLEEAKRHVLVDFGHEGLPTVLSTFDRLRAGSKHHYMWQINLGESTGDGGLTPSAGMEGGISTFEVSSADGAYLKGWVMSPANAVVNADDPLQVTVEGATEDLWIVLAAGKGAIPKAKRTGEGLGSTLELAGRVLGFDTTANRMTLSRVER
jgi:hypothetical protein